MLNLKKYFFEFQLYYEIVSTTKIIMHHISAHLITGIQLYFTNFFVFFLNPAIIIITF